jgi:hypothetical protein
MWALLSVRLRLWLLRAVGVPILGWLLGDRVEVAMGPRLPTWR